ncbi:MFS transporter [Natronosalvus caseinilyticus]|uniref:MFS transporter n=1 Tax=Natronosalvus caseinilyticus TaxID=2953747 RepID=UPI0028A70CE6|nr:MFS transporter [Natronosalvus caseinilyticus]
MSEPSLEQSGLRSIPWASPTFQVILATTLVGVMGVSLISPILPVLQTQFDLTDAQAGLIITVFTLPGIVLAPLFGALADRVGRRAIIVPCLVGFGVTGGSIAFVDDFTALLVLRFLQGATSSALIGLAVTLVGDRYEGTQRNTLMGVNRSALSIGATLYPTVGGALAILAWYAPFLVYFVGVGVGFFALYALETQAIEQQSTGFSYLREAVSALPIREAMVLYVAVFSSIVLLYGALLTSLPLLLSDAFALRPFEIGVLLAAASITNAAIATQSGRLTLSFSTRTLIVTGFCCYGIALVGIGLAPTPVYVGASILFFGAGEGLAMPLLDTELSKLSPAGFRAGVMNVRTSVIRLGQTLAPVVFTTVAGFVGYSSLLFAAGVLTLGVTAAVVAFTR